MEMRRLTQDGTAEPVSRDQFLRREWGQGNIHFPAQLTTSRIGNLTRLIQTLAICDDCTYIHTTGTKGTGTRVGSGMAKKRLRSARNR